MTDTTDLLPANENQNPFLRFDTALPVLVQRRREVLAIDPDRYSFEQWKQRERVLKQLDDAIRLCQESL